MEVFMLFGFPFIAFIYFIWFITVPCLIGEWNYPEPDIRKPLGLKIWSLSLSIFLALLPFFNISAILVSLIFLFVEIQVEGFNNVFERTPNILRSFIKFLNKELVKPKKNDSHK